MADRKLIALVVLIAVLFTLHIADHAVRGDISWPTTWEAVAGLTVNGGIYVLIAIGLVLYTHGQIGPGPWAIASVFGLAMGWLARGRRPVRPHGDAGDHARLRHASVDQAAEGRREDRVSDRVSWLPE